MHRARFPQGQLPLDEARLDILAECAEKQAHSRNVDSLVHVAVHDVPELIAELVRLKGIE